MYILKFSLKQHTPIIHFQHDQYGATLRASELKPKLDKFIIAKAFNDTFDQCKRYLVGYSRDDEIRLKEQFEKEGYRALNYNVHTYSLDDNPEKKTKIKLLTDNSEASLNSKSVNFTIVCFNKTLFETVSATIDEFFVLTSFGKRQDKGWGCFYPESLKDWSKVAAKLLACGRSVYIADFEFNGDMERFHQEITRCWRILKSGSNFRTYTKSLLFKYMCESKTRWDKRWIKKELQSLIENKELPVGLLVNPHPRVSNEPNDCVDPMQPSNNKTRDYQGWEDNAALDFPYRFGRALLGLAEHYEFHTKDKTMRYQVRVINDDGIERFKSPVTFKVFYKQVYAIAESIGEFILDKPFHFEVQKKRKGKDGWVDEGQPIAFTEITGEPKQLRTPVSFSLSEFLDDYMKYIGFKRLKP